MKLCRKLTLGVVATLGLLLPLANAPEAKAGPSHGHAQRIGYNVYYRTCPHDSWHYFGSYSSAQNARQAGQALQARGYAWWAQPFSY